MATSGSKKQCKIGFHAEDIDAIEIWRKDHGYADFSKAVRALTLAALHDDDDSHAERIGRIGQVLNALLEVARNRNTAVNRAQVESLCESYYDSLNDLSGRR